MMKKFIYGMMMAAAGLMITSCEDFTDIQPKGENLLSSTNDLELLLNTDNYDELYSNDFIIIGSNIIYNYSSVPALLSVDNKSRAALLYGYFEDQTSLNTISDLTSSDGFYEACYNIIGRVANPILNQLELAKGTEAEKNELRAEALIARAYCHFLALQKYAPAYNGSNGDDPGIIYMTEDKNILESQPKNSIKECYDFCMKDIDEALALNALPEEAVNYMRWSKYAALALKALVHLNMREYAEAEATAKQVLSAPGKNLYDYWQNAIPAGSFSYESHDERNINEWLFIIPAIHWLEWASPMEWNSLDPNYGRRALTYTMDRATGMDYGALFVGLPGWDSPYDVMFQNYSNAMGLHLPMMYLIIAECELRAGNISASMNWLDQLRAKRMPDGFEHWEGSVTEKGKAINPDGTYHADGGAIAKLEQTVAAEFLWQDWTFVWRKRWNTESDWATTQTREIGGTTYTLRPDSKLWVFPFPKTAREKNLNLTNNW